jgi:hypothetical protein
MRTKTCLLITVMLFSAAMVAQKKPAARKADKSAQALITKLRATPVADMETGLPTEPFSKWFAAQTKPGSTGYQVKACEAGSDRDIGYKCIVATAKVGEFKKLELTFAVPPDYTGKKPINVRETQFPCRFLVGSLGPANPRMKSSTRVITKLSDLPPLLSR